jgi:hypothetical protein
MDVAMASCVPKSHRAPSSPEGRSEQPRHRVFFGEAVKLAILFGLLEGLISVATFTALCEARHG